MIYTLPGREPIVDESAFVAPTADIIGSVVLERDSSVWFGAVLRGDMDVITVGARTNVQDGAVLHTDPGLPLTLGTGVVVGHKAVVHGCTVGDHSLIGIQSVVLNRAVIGRYCVIGAGAVITEGKEIPDYSLVVGCPGRIIRTLGEDQRAKLERMADEYVKKARLYRESLRTIA